ncbi:DUF5134 domain-containing protein [Nocardia sp. NPDC003482]
MGGFVLEFGALRWGVLLAFAVTGAIVAGRVAAGSLDREADAAHLLMCLVMGVMLVFPVSASHHAISGVLTAMVVVYALLLGDRIIQRRNGTGPAIAYHLVAAAAMLYAMSAHLSGGHRPVLIALAVLFAADAALTLLPTRISLWHTLIHPSGAAGPSALVPHLVMDLGTAYMMIAASA